MVHSVNPHHTYATNLTMSQLPHTLVDVKHLLFDGDVIATANHIGDINDNYPWVSKVELDI